MNHSLQDLTAVRNIVTKENTFYVTTDYKSSSGKTITRQELFDDVIDFLSPSKALTKEFTAMLLKDAQQRYKFRRPPKSLGQLLRVIAHREDAEVTFTAGGPVTSFSTLNQHHHHHHYHLHHHYHIEPQAPAISAPPLKAFSSTTPMVHQKQQSAECLLIAFRVASRSEHPSETHFHFFQHEFQNGFTISSLRMALSQVSQQQNDSPHFVLKKLPGGWNMLNQLSRGVYIVQCMVKIYQASESCDPTYPHFVALDMNYCHISDSMRDGLIDFASGWSRSNSHDIISIGAIYQIMVVEKPPN